MAITSTFREAVKSKSVRKVRIMMEDSLLVDPTFRKFEEMEKEAESMKDILYDKHDGREFRRDKCTWDENYMNELMVQVIRNYSHERVDHLKEVVRYLRPVEEKACGSFADKDGRSGREEGSTQTKERDLNYQEQKKRDGEEGNIIKVAGGAAAGAVAGGILAGVLDAPVAAGVLAGAVIVGVPAYIYTGKE